MTPGLRPFYNPNEGFSLVVPENWVEDLEFGRAIAQDLGGDMLAKTVVYTGGILTPNGGLDPNLWVMKSLASRHTDLKAAMEQLTKKELRRDESLQVASQGTILLNDGTVAEEVRFLSPASNDFTEGSTMVEVLVKRQVKVPTGRH